MRILLDDEAATEQLAEQLAARARPGDVLLLSGPLGAGKSSFARAFIRALAGTLALVVPSPTFTLVQNYETPRGMVWHFDFWRLETHAGIAELGWDEAQAGIVLVEWPERLGPLAPDHALKISLSYATPGRAVVLTGGASHFYDS